MIKHIHRSILFTVGSICVVLGVIGIFLPLLPTTPFILLAAICFSKSSERVHQWLLNHRLFGGLISDWEEYGVIRRKIKWIATSSIMLMSAYPIAVMIPYLWLKIVTVAAISIVILFIWTRPSEPLKPLPQTEIR